MRAANVRLHDAAKHGCDHLDAVSRTVNNVNKMASRHSCTSFDVDHTIEDAPVCDAASRVAAAMVSELRVYVAENVIELFLQTLVVLQTTPILDSF
ncbi:hypothetical protein TNCV_4586481 [Trichonephila clavipes]|nr:hypothetical protein TNCV_4586481 [Trichonephila clavipes]